MRNLRSAPTHRVAFNLIQRKIRRSHRRVRELEQVVRQLDGDIDAMEVERDRLSRHIIAREGEKQEVMESLMVSRRVYGEAVIDYNCLQQAQSGLSDVTDFESDESREGSQAPIPERVEVGQPPAEQFLDAEGSGDDLCLVVADPPSLEAGVVAIVAGSSGEEEEDEEEDEEVYSFQYETSFASSLDQGEVPPALDVDEESSIHSSMPSLEPITPPLSIRGD